jgi:hypothetical protein
VESSRRSQRSPPGEATAAPQQSRQSAYQEQNSHSLDRDQRKSTLHPEPARGSRKCGLQRAASGSAVATQMSVKALPGRPETGRWKRLQERSGTPAKTESYLRGEFRGGSMAGSRPACSPRAGAGSRFWALAWRGVGPSDGCHLRRGAQASFLWVCRAVLFAAIACGKAFLRGPPFARHPMLWPTLVLALTALLSGGAQAATVFAAWVPTDWSACSQPCGGGVQFRSVDCRDSDLLVS